ncbi:unnamed protein product [Peniophora sp. CBMAI 1063]|nr:unnamed protein product [Peniophora sp. CBMAI 1063]
MANIQYPSLSESNANKPILPRTLRRREAGWDSTMFSTNLVVFHVPSDGAAHWTHVNVVHFNVDDGKTMVLWRQFWEDRARTAYVTLPNGRKYLVLVPYNRDGYQFSTAVEEKLGFRWRGEMLVFACSMSTGLLVNMRTWQDDKVRAWSVVSRYITGDVDREGSGSDSDSDAESTGYTDLPGLVPISDEEMSDVDDVSDVDEEGS